MRMVVGTQTSRPCRHAAVNESRGRMGPSSTSPGHCSGHALAAIPADWARPSPLSCHTGNMRRDRDDARKSHRAPLHGLRSSRGARLPLTSDSPGQGTQRRRPPSRLSAAKRAPVRSPVRPPAHGSRAAAPPRRRLARPGGRLRAAPGAPNLPRGRASVLRQRWVDGAKRASTVRGRIAQACSHMQHAAGVGRGRVGRGCGVVPRRLLEQSPHHLNQLGRRFLREQRVVLGRPWSSWSGRELGPRRFTCRNHTRAREHDLCGWIPGGWAIISMDAGRGHIPSRPKKP
jgi:hypothetical protein